MDFEGKTLHYGIKDLSIFKNQQVLVCGGGDSAVDWALMLEDIAANVTLVHRRERFTAHETSVNQLMESKVNVLTSRSVKRLKVKMERSAELFLLKKTAQSNSCLSTI